MLNYIFSNPREYNEILQYFTLFLIFVIGFMVYSMNSNTDDLKDDIHNLHLECPPCPISPGCPRCPSLKCKDNNDDDNNQNIQCPECPKCPSVNDIVSGIFPGRNTGITSGGKYFDIKANESYDLLPDFDYYNPVDAFPVDSILSQSVNYKSDSNPNVDNSIDNDYTNTSKDKPMII